MSPHILDVCKLMAEHDKIKRIDIHPEDTTVEKIAGRPGWFKVCCWGGLPTEVCIEECDCEEGGVS